MTYVKVCVIHQDNKTSSLLIWGSHTISPWLITSYPCSHHWQVRFLSEYKPWQIVWLRGGQLWEEWGSMERGGRDRFRCSIKLPSRCQCHLLWRAGHDNGKAVDLWGWHSPQWHWYFMSNQKGEGPHTSRICWGHNDGLFVLCLGHCFFQYVFPRMDLHSWVVRARRLHLGQFLISLKSTR